MKSIKTNPSSAKGPYKGKIYNSILNSLEKKEAHCFVFCDFSKAFDKAWYFTYNESICYNWEFD